MSARSSKLGRNVAAHVLALAIVVPSIAGARWPFGSSESERAVVVVDLDPKSGAVTARRVDEREVPSLHAREDGGLTAAFRLDTKTGQIDPLDAGLSWYWLAFGFGAQLVFTARMLAQWIASERARASVVPLSFWILSVVGGLMLLAYFVRRGDPVGVAGQAFDLTVYGRNLLFIRRRRRQARSPVPVGAPGSFR